MMHCKDDQVLDIRKMKDVFYLIIAKTEMEGFEPSYRDEPINAFRVRRVTAASLHLLTAEAVKPLLLLQHFYYT